MRYAISSSGRFSAASREDFEAQGSVWRSCDASCSGMAECVGGQRVGSRATFFLYARGKHTKTSPRTRSLTEDL